LLAWNSVIATDDVVAEQCEMVEMETGAEDVGADSVVLDEVTATLDASGTAVDDEDAAGEVDGGSITAVTSARARSSWLGPGVKHLVGVVLSTSSAPRITGSGKRAGALRCAVSHVVRATRNLVGAGVGGEGADEDVAGAVVSSLPEVVKMASRIVLAAAADEVEVAGEGARRSRQS
jgi:hypothetical protein